MKQAYTMAVRSAGSKRDEYVNDYAVKLIAIITTGQGYTSNRVQAYVDIAQYYNYKDDSKNAKKTIQQAYEMLTAHKQYMTKETVRQYNEAVQLIGGTAINETEYFNGKAGIAVMARKLQGKDTKPVIIGLSKDIVAKDIIAMGDAIVSVNGKPVKEVDDIEHELSKYAHDTDIVVQLEQTNKNKYYAVINKKSIIAGNSDIEYSEQAKVVTLTGLYGNVHSIAYSPDGRYIVSGSEDTAIKVWDATTYKEVATLTGHYSTVYSVAYSPDGKYIVSGSEDKTIKVWDARTYKEVAKLIWHDFGVESVAYSPDGKYIVSGSNDYTIKVWDAQTYTGVATLRGHFISVTSVAYSPDGRYIVSGSEDKTVKIWDAITYKNVATLRGHNDDVESVAYSPDGRYIVSGSRDNTIKVWDATTYTAVATLRGHSDWVYSVAYSPDGRYIVSGSRDRTIKVWDATTYKEVATLRGHGGEVNSVAYSPDGKYIVSGSFDRTIKLWDMQVILPKVF